MAKEKICGIYKIENLINGKVYIGLSQHIYQRWQLHKNDLNGNRHDNQYLQNAWNKYGKDNFKFEIIEKCDISLVEEKEEYYITLYNSCNRKKGYNMNFGGKLHLHTEEVKQKISKSNKGKIRSKETREKLRKANLGNKLEKDHPFLLLNRNGENNPMYGVHRYGQDSPHYGKKHNDKSKENMSLNSTNMNVEQIIYIKVLLKYSNLTIKKISSIVGVKEHQVNKIKYNNSFSFVSIDNVTEEEIKNICCL